MLWSHTAFLCYLFGIYNIMKIHKNEICAGFFVRPVGINIEWKFIETSQSTHRYINFSILMFNVYSRIYWVRPECMNFFLLNFSYFFTVLTSTFYNVNHFHMFFPRSNAISSARISGKPRSEIRHTTGIRLYLQISDQ